MKTIIALAVVIYLLTPCNTDRYPYVVNSGFMSNDYSWHDTSYKGCIRLYNNGRVCGSYTVSRNGGMFYDARQYLGKQAWYKDIFAKET